MSWDRVLLCYHTPNTNHSDYPPCLTHPVGGVVSRVEVDRAGGGGCKKA